MKLTLFLDICILLTCLTTYSAEIKNMPKTKFKKITDIQKVEFLQLPEIGQYEKSQIQLGGFSALEFVQHDKKTNSLVFRTITDRGPNGEIIESHPTLGKNLRPFLIPDFSPLLIDFELTKNNELKIIKTDHLLSSDGKKINGLPAIAQDIKNPNSAEIAFAHDRKLPPSDLGFDIEGYCSDPQGRTWISEEYYPSVAVFDKNKKLIKRLLPGTDFPEIFKERKVNRGFEALTCDNEFAYLMLQSPLKNKKFNAKNIIRLLRINLQTLKAVDQFAFQLTDEEVDKIGDITNSNGDFFVIEQNGKSPTKSKQFISQFKIDQKKSIPLDAHPEEWDTKKLSSTVLQKDTVYDLSDSPTKYHEKLEGIAIYEDTLYIITDNDFGLKEEKKTKKLLIDPNQKPALFKFKIK